MARKRFQQPKTGLPWLKSKGVQFLSRIGAGKHDVLFLKVMGRRVLYAYALIGAGWLYNETSPLGWWTLKPRPKEEKELAHLYERREFPYPGDKEAMEEFIAKGGMIGTAIGPKGVADFDKDACNYQKQLQDQKLQQEAQKLWLRMRNEVISELQQKGYEFE
ncbi:hypothetical protein UlMin_013262 [Ulmus minor]